MLGNDRAFRTTGVGTVEGAIAAVELATASCHGGGGELEFEVTEIVESIFRWEDSHRAYADTNSVHVFRLRDGRIGVAIESSDSTGHG